MTLPPHPGPGAARTSLRRAASGGWVGVAANPASGRGRGRAAVERLSRALADAGIRARPAWTPAGRAGLVAEAADDPACRAIVAAGGDGTVAALLNERPAVPVAVLPTGTENLFARQVGAGRVADPEALARTIAAGRALPMDLGLAGGGRRFALMAGLGFDADVIARHHLARLGRQGRARPTGRLHYVAPVLASSLRYRFPEVVARFEAPGGEEETLSGAMAFVFNLPRYALGLPVAPDARGDDGWLDLLVFREPGPFRALRYLWDVVRGAHLGRPDVAHRRVRRVGFEAPGAVPLQLDGDPGGLAWPAGGSLGVEVLPGAVEVLVPPGWEPPGVDSRRRAGIDRV